MRVSYEKLIIREERAQIGQVALMKLAFLLSKSQNLKTYTRLFEEEGCTCNLRTFARKCSARQIFFKL